MTSSDSTKGSVIPAKSSGQFSTWLAPEVQDGQIVQSEKLKKRGPRGELVNINKDEVIYNRLTAAQLEEISQQAYEDVREQAYKDGFQQGQKEGLQAGLLAGEEHIRSQGEQLKSVMASLVGYLEDQDNDIERALVNVATTIAGSILRRELILDNSQIQTIVNEAIAALPMEPANLTIFLNEQDKQQLDKNELPDHWKVNVDPTMTAGGCRVVTRQSVVDYSFEQQFEQVVTRLVDKRYEQLAVADESLSDPSNKPSLTSSEEPSSPSTQTSQDK
jgi:flagellar assembly protein FliH